MLPFLGNDPLDRSKYYRYFNDQHARDSPEPEDDVVSIIAQYGHDPGIKHHTLNRADSGVRPRLTPCINCVRSQIQCVDELGAKDCQHCYWIGMACVTPHKRRSLKKVRFDVPDDDDVQSEPEISSKHQYARTPKSAHLRFTDPTSRSTDDQVNRPIKRGPYEYDSEPEAQSFSQRGGRTAVRSNTISSSMTPTEIAQVLGNHGCTNLTGFLDLQACSGCSVSSGGFGDVYSGRLKDGVPVAIKVTRLYIIQRQNGKHLKHAAEELHTWSKCRHPNVLPLLGLAEFREQIAMISPWINNGSVREYLSKQPGANRWQVCHGIACGLAYLHGIQVIHGDLKGANVLISDDGVPMLTDFGNSVLEDCSVQFTQSTVKQNVSPRWTAPEVFRGTVSYSYEADVFSLGMTLLETITGEIPYSKLRRDEAVIAAIMITKGPPERPEAHIPTLSSQCDKLWTLLTSCWAYKPESRPSAAVASDMMKTTMDWRILPPPV